MIEVVIQVLPFIVLGSLLAVLGGLLGFVVGYEEGRKALERRLKVIKGGKSGGAA